jgi:hypothetical protein
MARKDLYLKGEAPTNMIIDILLEMESNAHAYHSVMIKYAAKGDEELAQSMKHDYDSISHSYRTALIDCLKGKYSNEISLE